jgi:hypothetical protein
MAITSIEYALFSLLKQERVLPARPHVMELGESNWYGDVPAEVLQKDIQEQIKDPAVRDHMCRDLDMNMRSSPKTASWDIAKLFYRIFLDYATISAIDGHGSDSAYRWDLNYPIQQIGQFDIWLIRKNLQHSIESKGHVVGLGSWTFR